MGGDAYIIGCTAGFIGLVPAAAISTVQLLLTTLGLGILILHKRSHADIIQYYSNALLRKNQSVLGLAARMLEN